jgi:hypothetical protein
VLAGVLLVLAAHCTEAASPFRYINSFGKRGVDDGELAFPVSIDVGADSLVYVGDSGNARVCVFSSEGQFVRQWSLLNPENHDFPRIAAAVAIRADRQGLVYVVIRGEGPFVGLSIFSKDGAVREPWKGMNSVGGLEIDDEGNFYLYGTRANTSDAVETEVMGPRVWKFNPSRELIKSWGDSDPHDGAWRLGTPMTWNSKGNLLVLGSQDSVATVFEYTRGGARVSTWQIPGTEALHIKGMAADAAGHVFVSRMYDNSMCMYDEQGHLIDQWNVVGADEEPLDMPGGVAVDREGHLYVVDWSRARVVKYDTNR